MEKTTKKKRIMADLLISINNGIYQTGDKLPSLRNLAESNDISLYTAMNVYNDLISFGVIENRLRSGYFVTPVDHQYLDDLTKKLDESTQIQQMVQHGYDTTVYGYYVYEQYFNNAARLPSKTCFQLSRDDIGDEYFSLMTYDSVQKIAKALTAEKRWSSFDDAENQLAAQIARWMLNYKCLLKTKYITITSDASQALLLAMRVCHRPGKVVGIESPGHMAFGYCARFLSIEYKELPGDSDTGLCIDDLSSAIDDGVQFSAIVLSSCSSTPTGAVMPESNKKRLIELCNKNSIPIIEYDGCGYTSTFRRNNHPLKAMDHESIIYVSDFSMVYGANFPIGFIESGKQTRMLQFQKVLSNSRVPADEQLALSDLLLTGNTMKHIEKVSKDICAAVALFKETLIGLIPDSVSVKDSPGSPYLWIRLPEGGNIRSFCNLAYANNVLLALAPLFTAIPEFNRCFRVNCCATKKPRQIIAGAEVLGRVISDFVKRQMDPRQR